MTRRQTNRRADNESANRLQRANSLAVEALEDRSMLATFLPGELLVQYEPGIDAATRASARSAIAATLVEQIHTAAMDASGRGVLERVAIGKGLSLDTAVQRMSNLPGVRYAEPNWVYTPTYLSNDTSYLSGSMWGMYSDDSPSAVGPSGTTNPFGSQAEEAWNAGFIGSNSIYIGVIDEGIQFTHPDLAANVWSNPFDPIDGVDNDGNGRIDDSQGWDFFNNDRTVYDGTSDDHATHVAGTIGAVGGNGSGVAGVNWNVTMISTKFLGPTGGYTSGAVQALDYLTDLKTRHGLNIIATNNSWGGGGFSQSLLDAITRAANQGILFVAAAGNSSSNNDATASYPSNYNTTSGAGYDSVIAVASITSSGGLSSFSSYGATTVDLGAPGSSILSTVPSNGYGTYSGTSMATPHVTGAIALYAAANPGSTAAQLRAALLGSTTATTSLSGRTLTGGRLNVNQMLGGAPALPSLQISDVSVTEGNSGTVNANFNVTLSNSSTSIVTVNFATANGSAVSPGDYTGGSGQVTFNPGVTSQTISIPVVGDTTVESNETFTVNLSGAVNATIGDASGTGTIVNDDMAASRTLSINDVTGVESQGSFVFTVSLSSASTTSVTVKYATANGTATGSGGSRVRDFTHRSGSLNFSPGQVSKTISIVVRNNSPIEPTEYFYVNLSSAVGATIADGQGVGTILDDDGGTASSATGPNASSLHEGPAAFAFETDRVLTLGVGSEMALEVLTDLESQVNPAALPGIARARQSILARADEPDPALWRLVIGP